MANKVRFEIEGLDELLRELDRMPEKMTRQVQQEALRAAAQPILSDAKQNAPEKTGKGKRGLKISRLRGKGSHRYVLVGIDRSDHSEIYYMKFHEFGTSRMRARPFLGPAYEKNKGLALQLIRQTVRKGLGLK